MIIFKIAFAIIMIGVLIAIWWATLFMLKGKNTKILIKMRAIAVILIVIGGTVCGIGFISLVWNLL